MAELYESEGDEEKAMEAYQQAAEFYEGEGSIATANGCLVKVATFAANLGKYQKSIEVFEQVATAGLDTRLGQYKSKEYFLNAGICHCLVDVVGAKRASERYKELDFKFVESYECKLFTKMLEAIEAFDADAFTAAVQEFDKLIRLDQWRTSLLLKIKDTIHEETESEDLL